MNLGFEKASPKLYTFSAVASGDVDVWNALASLGDIHVGGWHLAESMDYICVHEKADILFSVDKGAGELNVGAGTYALKPGSIFILPAGVMYQITVSEPLDIITLELTGESLRVSEEARGIDSIKPLGQQKESLPTRTPEEETQEKSWAVLSVQADDMESTEYDTDPLTGQNSGDLLCFNAQDLANIAQPVWQAPHAKGGFLTVHIKQEVGGEEGFICTDNHLRFNGSTGFTMDFYGQMPFEIHSD